MNELLDQLLQLKNLSTGDTSVALEWARPFPAWLWALLAPACVGAAAWSYSRQSGRAGARAALACARALVLLLLAVLIAGPQLVKQTQRVEKDWVAVLLDRSASMMVADAPGGVSREAQMRESLTQAWPMFEELSKGRNVVYMGFDGATYELPGAGAGSPPRLPEPTGSRTRVGQAIQQTLRRLAARPVAGIVIVSDGRSGDALPREALRELEARQIPVFVAPLGSEKPVEDLAIARVDSPGTAFVGDLVPVTVEIERRGGEGEPTPGLVQLVDIGTGEVLDEQPLPGAGEPGLVTLTARPKEAGAGAWSVRVTPDRPDLSADNNAQPVAVDLVERPIRVAYFDGYPRWEYRYLKYTLVREASVSSAISIISPDRRYIREGTEPIDGIPRSPEEWAAFDVIVIGDVRPELFSDEQLRQLRALVASRGAGLLWLGGPSATPGAWKSTPLSDLIPFTLSAFDTGSRGGNVWLDPVVMRPGDAVKRFGVLQLGDSTREPWPAGLSSGELGWTLLRWAQRIEPSWLKPTTEVLAVAAPVAPGGGLSSQSAKPLVMTMRYGAGRVVYVGTDEVWRYRYGRGETLPERFWIPLVRLLARESLGRAGKSALLEASPAKTRVDQQVQITARLLDQSLIDARPKSVTVKIARVDSRGVDAKRPPIELELRPMSQGDEDVELSPVSAFGAAWLAPEPGTYRVTTADPIFASLDLAAKIEVTAPDDELREPQADHGALAAIANASGGQVLPAAWLKTLPDVLPNRELRILGLPEIETLWDKPLAWMLLISLLTLEWVGRRVLKLS